MGELPYQVHFLRIFSVLPLPGFQNQEKQKLQI